MPVRALWVLGLVLPSCASADLRLPAKLRLTGAAGLISCGGTGPETTTFKITEKLGQTALRNPSVSSRGGLIYGAVGKTVSPIRGKCGDIMAEHELSGSGGHFVAHRQT